MSPSSIMDSCQPSRIRNSLSIQYFVVVKAFLFIFEVRLKLPWPMIITMKSSHCDMEIFLWSNIVPVITVKVPLQSLHLYLVRPTPVLPYLMIEPELHFGQRYGTNEFKRETSLSSPGAMCLLS